MINSNFNAENNRFYLYKGNNPSSKADFTEVTYIPVESKGSVPIKLELEDTSSLSFEFEHEYEYPMETLLSKTKSIPDLLIKVVQAGQNISSSFSSTEGSKAIYSQYQNIPAYKATSNLKMPDSLTFTFYFGQQGLFSGKLEVVEPIIALASLFVPNNSEKGYLIDLPYPDSAALLARLGRGFATNQSDDSEIIDESFIQAATNIMNKVNKAAANAFEPSTVFLYGKLGNIQTPIFFIDKVGFKFNSKEIDMDGFPISGTITLSGIQTIKVATKDLL